MTGAHRLADRPDPSTALPPGQQDPAAEDGPLRDHLLGEHGRSGREIDGLPLADLHRFEHVEQAMGLTDLSHWHSADGATHRPSAANADEADP